ncbi:hypothetical protein SAZ_22375 [Streptomyces noursei ZPM]|uniref:Aromatic ring-opening dioxygenase LigA n=1 Tax=Streptomyces noursei TaxID=1971 RepID=A0A401R3W6_STRNR|nr:hypothetical protein [Streptomyces noursei]AKA04889.1 hypothetical protein SAZ_22375 [Streptomyces noursei ZPM]EPY93539.1 hypothetical protein K530_47525 [Streptomyces noursei CCRC 11814]EXU91425.1 hypothetical protein P354_03425 [Streptomyces noursei PD-1]UWS73273.1 hypothetical protein N1H47_19690 [Streptomyces noursei]GCB92293.1 hypothetical protein SALB_05055 [Streptomyces noursei]
MTRHATGMRGPATLAALALLALTAAPVAAAAGAPGYRTASGSKPVKGAESAAQAPRLDRGQHVDTFQRGQTKYYAVALDDISNAYFSVVAAPRPGTKVEDYTDRLTVKVEDSGGTTCGPDGTAQFHSGGTAYPVADYAARLIGPDVSNCQHAGPYYVVVSREGPLTSGPEPWAVEIGHLTEPALKGTAPSPSAPGGWSSATPAPPTDATTHQVLGGTGFNDAAAVGRGVWRDHLAPGETRFYRVPVDWGQRLNLSAELPNSTGSTTAFVPSALGLTVYNPARGAVSQDGFVPFDGKPAAARAFTAPVAYGNRATPQRAVAGMRFAGWYYVAVTLSARTAVAFPQGAALTLRVDLRGTPQAGPDYASPAGDLGTPPGDDGTGRPAQGAGGPRTAVAYAGIGVGVLLLAGLGAWTVLARRAAARGAVPAVPPGPELPTDQQTTRASPRRSAPPGEG